MRFPSRPTVRATPALPITAMKTYSTSAPPATHFRPATCEEVACEAWRSGWATIVDERAELGMGQAAWIRATYNDHAKPAQVREGERWYRESRTAEGLTVFTFDAGQPCFARGDHRVPLDRPALYLVRGGDWRGNTGLIRRHSRPSEWIEDMQQTTDRLVELHERG